LPYLSRRNHQSDYWKRARNIEHRVEYEYSSKPKTRTCMNTLHECSQWGVQTQASQVDGKTAAENCCVTEGPLKPTSTIMMTTLQYYMTFKSHSLTTGNINRIHIPSVHQYLAQIESNAVITTST
jgi:heme/copper-type cytochrome/quinol oxidase subunit 2